MLSKQIHRGVNRNKDLSKGIENIKHAKSEHVKNIKRLSVKRKNVPNGRNSITSKKNMTQINSSRSDLQLNKAPRKLNMSSVVLDKKKDNLYTTELSSSPVVRNSKVHVHIRNTRLSTRNLSPFTNNYSPNSSKTLTTQKILMLTTNSHPELQKAAVKHNLKKCTESAKIALRSSKSKIRNSNSINLTPIMSNDFRRTNTKRRSCFDRNNVPLTKNYITDVKRDVNVDQPTNINMADILKENVFNVKESIVLVQKLNNIITLLLSPQSLSSPMMRVLVSDQFINCNINVSQETYNSLLNPLTTAKVRHSKKANSCTKLRQNVDYQHVRMKNSLHVQEDATKPLSSPIMYSTPKVQQGLNEIDGKRKSSRIKHKCDTTLESSISSTFSTQCQHHGNVNTDEMQEKVKQQNETYELIEPKTPVLRKKLKEHHSKTTRKGVKENVRVHFNSVTDIKKQILKSPVNTRQRRLNLVNGKDKSAMTTYSPYTKIDQSAHSFATVNVATASHPVNNTKQTAKKIPNFSLIHKNIFAKFESIVDTKKRLKDRHTTLTTAKVKNLITVTSNLKNEKQLASKSDTVNYNRVGSKIRKQEATNCILRNTDTHVTRGKERRRAILNGVRTNRRFELLMKSRNINL